MTSIIRCSDDSVVVGNFASGYKDPTPILTLKEEVRKEGLDPVVYRLWRQNRDSEASDLIDLYS